LPQQKDDAAAEPLAALRLCRDVPAPGPDSCRIQVAFAGRTSGPVQPCEEIGHPDQAAEWSGNWTSLEHTGKGAEPRLVIPFCIPSSTFNTVKSQPHLGAIEFVTLRRVRYEEGVCSAFENSRPTTRLLARSVAASMFHRTNNPLVELEGKAKQFGYRLLRLETANG